MWLSLPLLLGVLPIQGPSPTYSLSQALHDRGRACRPLYGSDRDADRDGLCDAAELELARRAAPVLKLPSSEPFLDAMRTLWQVHDAGHGEVVISYVQAYVADLHPGRVAPPTANHPGDTEEVRFWLHARDDRTFQIVRARYWHHTGRQDWAINDPDRTVSLETIRTRDGVHPVVWVQQNAHGSYLDRERCARDPEGNGEPCGDGLRLESAISARTNVGEATAHILGDDDDKTARVSLTAVGFPGESPWTEKHNGFGVRGFCGGAPGTGLFGTVAEVAGRPLAYRRRVFAPVCAGPLSAQWDRMPAGTEDIIYWQGFHSIGIGAEHGRPAVAAGRIFVRAGDRLRVLAAPRGATAPHAGATLPEVALAGDPAATTWQGHTVLAYARRADGHVVTRTDDAREHDTGLRDAEVALATVRDRVFAVDRTAFVTSADGGRTFSAPTPLPRRLRDRPAAAQLAGRLCIAYRTDTGGLAARVLEDPSAREVPIAPRADRAPWAAASRYDHGALYVFSTMDRAIRYYKVFADGRGPSGPVEIPDAQTRSGGAVAEDGGDRLLLAHDAGSGMFVRVFDPDLPSAPSFPSTLR
jgi:hypothetical protein